MVLISLHLTSNIKHMIQHTTLHEATTTKKLKDTETTSCNLHHIIVYLNESIIGLACTLYPLVFKKCRTTNIYRPQCIACVPQV